jgi:site-specific recombinase XerD
MYEAGKHSMATEAYARIRDERKVQAILGHADVRSTRRYARLTEGALVEVLRPRTPRKRD